jgi:hypothetical protein
VDRIRGETDGVIAVDAGDLFLAPGEVPKGWKAPAKGEVERRARVIAAAYGRMGVDAVTPGEADLALGPALLKGVLADAKVPVVSANLMDLKGEAVFDAERIVDVAGVKVGIFGVTAMANAARMRAWGFEARDVAQAARAAVGSLRARGAKIVIALVHVGGAAESRTLVREVPGIDWVVLGHSGLNLELPESVGGARLLEAMSLGKNLGHLDLHVVAGDGRGPYAERAARAQLVTILADHRHQVAEYEQRLPQTDNPSMRAYYEQRVAALRGAIARESAELEKLPPRVSGNWFENRVIPLDTAVPDQPGVALLVDAYNRESDRLAATGAPVGIKPVNPAARGPREPTHVGPLPDEPRATYAGTAACVSCHKPAADQWRTTKHAHALETLEKVHRARSPACIGCHVTGYLQPGGTTDIQVATTRLRDVGCESCHGPGSAHVIAADKKTSITRKVPASVCLGCHTPDQTNEGFDYTAFLPAILGPGHGQPIN